MSEHLINEIFPFIVMMSITGMVFLYLTIRLFLRRHDNRKHLKRRSSLQGLERDQQDLEGALDRAENLSRRVQALEEILLSEKPKQE